MECTLNGEPKPQFIGFQSHHKNKRSVQIHSECHISMVTYLDVSYHANSASQRARTNQNQPTQHSHAASVTGRGRHLAGTCAGRTRPRPSAWRGWARVGHVRVCANVRKGNPLGQPWFSRAFFSAAIEVQSGVVSVTCGHATTTMRSAKTLDYELVVWYFHSATQEIVVHHQHQRWHHSPPCQHNLLANALARPWAWLGEPKTRPHHFVVGLACKQTPTKYGSSPAC